MICGKWTGPFTYILVADAGKGIGNRIGINLLISKGLKRLIDVGPEDLLYLSILHPSPPFLGPSRCYEMELFISPPHPQGTMIEDIIKGASGC